MKNEETTLLLDNYYGTVKEAVAKKNEAQRSGRQNPIETFEHFSERQEAKAMGAAEHYLTDCQDYLKLILGEFKKNNQQDSIQELRKGAENFLAWLAKSKKSSEELTLKEIFGFSPKFTKSVCAMGQDFLNKNEPDKALKILKLLVTLDPTYEVYWIMYGLSLRLQNDESGALKAFEVAAKLDDKNPVIHFLIAQSYKSTGKIEEAKKYLKEASAEIAHFPNKFGFDELIKTEMKNF